MVSFFGVLAEFLIDQGLQIAVLFGVVGVLCFLLRRASSHVRYLLWMLVIAKCIFPSVMKISVAILPEKETAVAAANVAVLEPVDYGVETGVSVSADFADFEPDNQVVYEFSLMERLGEIGIYEWAGIAWFVGVVLYFGAASFRAWLLNRKLRSLRRIADLDVCVEECKGIKVWKVDGIGQPFVWGLLRGSVYVPGNFSKCGSVEDRRGILMHEFAHVRRFDAGVNLLQIFAQGLFWFHPLVWFANTMVRREREKCCDEAAIAKLKTVPRDYGRAIIDTLARECESGIPVPSLAVAGPVKNIEDRLKTIMRPGKKFYTRCGVFALLTILLLAVLAVPTGLVLTAKAESSVNNLEKEFFENWRANRAKLTSAKLVWKWNGNWPSQGVSNLTGDYKLWWDGKKITTEYKTDEIHESPEGKRTVEKDSGSTSYKGGVLSKRPQFNGFENWLDVIRWQGPGLNPLDKMIKMTVELDYVKSTWSMVEVDKRQMLELISKNIAAKKGVEKGAYTRYLFDPARGYCLVLDQTYNGKGRLYAERKRKVSQVASGLWFPYEVVIKSSDLKGNIFIDNRLMLDISKCRFNDKSAVPDEVFDRKIVDEQKSLDGLLKETSARLDKNITVHQELRKSIDAFLKAAVDGDRNKAAGFMGRQPLQDFDEMRELIEPWDVKVAAVYADSSAGLVITSVMQADGGRVGPLVFTVNNRDGKWLIDDIDVESAESTEEEIKRFGKERKDVRLVRFGNIEKVKAKPEIRTYDIKWLKELKGIDFQGDKKISLADMRQGGSLMPKALDHIENEIFDEEDLNDSFHGSVQPFGMNTIMVYHVPSVHDKIEAYLKELGEELKSGDKDDRPVMYNGFDLSKAFIWHHRSELDDLFELPGGSRSYRLRKDVKVIRSELYNEAYYVPKKNLFYVLIPADMTVNYYGPFKGDPEKVMKDLPPGISRNISNSFYIARSFDEYKIRDEQKTLDGLLKEASERLKGSGDFYTNISKRVDAFLNAVVHADKDEAAGFIERQLLESFNEICDLIKLEKLKIEAIYADSSAGLVITSVIFAGSETGPLVITVNKHSGKWLIGDIHIENTRSIEGAIESFGKEHKGAGMVRFDKKEKVGAKAIIFYGLDLSKGDVAAGLSEVYRIGDLFEERPAGSGSFEICKDVEKVYSGLDGAVYYVPAKNAFYVQHDLRGSSTYHYYGPFKGDPRKVLKGLPLRTSRPSRHSTMGILNEKKKMVELEYLIPLAVYDLSEPLKDGAGYGESQKLLDDIKKNVFPSRYAGEVYISEISSITEPSAGKGEGSSKGVLLAGVLVRHEAEVHKKMETYARKAFYAFYKKHRLGIGEFPMSTAGPYGVKPGTIREGERAVMRSYVLESILKLKNLKLFENDKEAFSRAAVKDSHEIVDHIKNEIFSRYTAHEGFKADIRLMGTSSLFIIHASRVHKQIAAYLTKLDLDLKAKHGIKEKAYIYQELNRPVQSFGNPLHNFLGFDLSRANVSTKASKLEDLFVERPAGSKSYHIRDGVKKIYSEYNRSIYNIEKKNIFYVQSDPVGSSTLHYYGPFKGDPRKVLKGLPLKGKAKFGAGGFNKELEARRKFKENPACNIEDAKKTKRPLMFYGLDLSGVAVTTKPFELADIFEQRPAGSGSYHMRQEVIQFQSHRPFGMVYWVPSKKHFYIQHDPMGSSTLHYYGPFKGNPREVLKNGMDLMYMPKPGDKQVSIQTRFIIVNTEFLEDIGKHLEDRGVKNSGKIKDPYFKPEVSYELFEGGKPMEKKQAADILRQIGLSGNDDLTFTTLDDKQVDFLLRMTNAHTHARTLIAPKITVLDGESGEISIDKEITYISGYEKAADDKTFQAIRGSFMEGIDIELLPRITTDRKYIILKFGCLIQNPIFMRQAKHKSGKEYDVPCLLKTQFDINFRFSDSEILMISGIKHFGMEDDTKDKSDVTAKFFESKKEYGNETLIILIQPTFIGPISPERAAIPAFTE